MDGLPNRPAGHRLRGLRGQWASGPEPLFELTVNIFCLSQSLVKRDNNYKEVQNNPNTVLMQS